MDAASNHYLTCAIIVSAWENPRYILDSLESIRRQEPRVGWRYELRLAVDGCPNTAAILDRRGIPYYWSPRNVGVYIMRNSLIEMERADAYAIFDSDDVMFPRYLWELLAYVERGMIAGAARFNTRADLKPLNHAPYKAGVCIIPHPAWKRLGGYNSHRVGSDVDLIDRARRLDIEVHRHPDVLYLRRKWVGSLTQSPATSFRSHFRSAQRRDHIQRIRKGILHVTPQTTELELRNG